MKETSSGLKTISRENWQEIISNGAQDLLSRILKTIPSILKDLIKAKEDIHCLLLIQYPVFMNDIRNWTDYQPDEAEGGWVNTLKAGLMWDSRDNRPNPMKGIWTEIGVEMAPKFMGNDWGFSRLYYNTSPVFYLN